MRANRKPKYPFEEYEGKMFGQWTVVEDTRNERDSMTHYWIVRCTCGNMSWVRPRDLMKGLSSHCRACTPKTTAFNEREVRRRAITRARQRARDHNFEFAIDHDYIDRLWREQGGTCALSGLPLNQAAKRPTASLDRIDSSKGYVPGNVQWVHKHINLMKNQLTEATFISLCRAVVRHAKPDPLDS